MNLEFQGQHADIGIGQELRRNIWGNNTHFKKSRKSFIHSGVLFVHLFSFVWVVVRKYVRLSNL